MLMLNFSPGALGFFVFKSAVRHWPQLCDRYWPGYQRELISCNSVSNHDVRPDVFVDTQDRADEAKCCLIRDLLTSQAVMLCHSPSVLPPDLQRLIQSHARTFNICCDNEHDRIAANWLFWIKAGDFHFRYLARNPNLEDDLQIFYNAIRNYVFAEEHWPEGHCLHFARLTDYDHMIPWFDAVRQEFNLERDIVQHRAWYQKFSTQSMSPLQQFRPEFEHFRHLWMAIKEHGPSDLPYTSVLEADNIGLLRRTMQFLSQYHHGQHIHK